MKGKQKTLLSDCEAISETGTPEVFLSPAFTDNEKQDTAEALIKIERNSQVFDTESEIRKNSDEISYYISTTVLSATDFGQAIRNHRGIENRNHHVRDVTMKEDRSRIRTNPHIFCKAEKFCNKYFEKKQCEKCQH
ncbi:transposase [Desulfococcaceae bacterium HSG7]|nr:transposase [Desulfococcaceae bacterium HSG7]